MDRFESHRKVLGEFNYSNSTAYDLAVVLVDFMNRAGHLSNANAYSSVEEAIRRWTDAKVSQAQPALTAKLVRAKDGLIELRDNVDYLIRNMDRPAKAPSDEG